MLASPGSLVAAEKEQLIAADRSPDRTPKLIALEGILLGRKVISSIHVAVSEKVEQCSMKAVGPGFGNDVDDIAWMQTILRRETRRLHAEFLDSIRKRKRQVYIGERIVIVSPIHQIIDVGRLRACDRDGHGAGIAWCRPDHLKGQLALPA